MDFKRSGSFDDLMPRAAPVPESFAPVPLSTVPEVSLVFSPSPSSRIQLKEKSPLHNLNNAPKLFAGNGVVTGKQLHDMYNTLQNERLGDRCSPVENDPHLTNANIQAKSSCINDKSIRQQDVRINSMMPADQIYQPTFAHNISYLQDVHVAKSYPNYERDVAQSVSTPRTFQNSSNYSITSKPQSRKATDINVADLHGSRMPEHHCSENVQHSSQMCHSPLGCVSNRLPPTTKSFDYYSCGKQQCCSNNDKCVLSQDMINNRTTFSAHSLPAISNVQHTLSPSGACKYGNCCMHNKPHTESVREFNNENVHNNQTGRHLNTQINVTRKSSEYNRHDSGNNEDESTIKRNTHSKDDIVLLNANRSKCKIETNVPNSKDRLFKKGIGVESSYADAQKQDARCKKSYDSVSNTSPDSPGKENDRKCTDTSILQEIALMNHKQCSILQGLLQQVVVMQADQMKILSEINEKLSNNRITEDVIPNKHENRGSLPEIYCKKEDASTQTIINEKVDFCCQKYDGSEVVIESVCDVINSSKKNCTNPAKQVNVDNQNMICPPIRGGQEHEQNKTRKIQDRAVSWSAVHGVETVEESFTLHGVCVPTVVEQLPSSVHTMHLHVQDYHSSASFDSIKESRFINDGSFENGQDGQKGSWTLYDNIVGHVKKFLQTVPCENGSSIQKTPQVEAIRFATIEKIRQLGVSVYENSSELKEVNAPGKIHFDSNIASQSPYPECTPVEKSRSDGSMELQALALKYLQDDDLSDLMKWNQSYKNASILKPGQKSANISLATQHYLEKYQLLPVGSDYIEKQQIANCVEDNILDITTLKKQPKLL
ncbi:hypothetical protein R5R35_006141 [Gryllus longicercus]|uniref:Uncharacterized protein n=1 Tax=Gryllus longicercus TaxID=2509291 RepID=A0AAN9Z3H6_9ORTH